MEPENTPLEKENHVPNHHFQVLCKTSGVYVFFGWVPVMTTESTGQSGLPPPDGNIPVDVSGDFKGVK